MILLDLSIHRWLQRSGAIPRLWKLCFRSHRDDPTSHVCLLNSLHTSQLYFRPEFHPHECGVPFQVVHAQLEGVENPTDSVMGPIVYDIIRKSPQNSIVVIKQNMNYKIYLHFRRKLQDMMSSQNPLWSWCIILEDRRCLLTILLTRRWQL